jgi:class 3 adenylate cyclase
VRVEQRLEGEQISEDTVQQMLLLAERLRESHGGELDDEAIVAVSEATGAPVDYVRIALANRPRTEKQTVTKKLRGTYLSLNPDERAWVAASAIGAGAGMAYALDQRFPRSNGLFGILMLILVVAGFYAIGTRKDSRLATISGALLGSMGVISSSVFGLLLGLSSRGAPMLILPLTAFGAGCGFFIHKLISQNRRSLGLKDAVEERQDLMLQLQELRAKLESGKQSLTFLSVDVVGSSKMKAGVDQLDVEYTFSEFHKFVSRVTTKYSGTVHSTAGDGVTCAFDHPQQAFQAAKNIQIGIIELNTFGNKLRTPIVLRCGIHTGEVVAPDARDVTSVNFAQVIDIAAHLQKVCPAGGIAVSQESAIHVPGGPAQIGTEKVSADGVTGYVWLPKTRPLGQTSATPPPFAPEQA